ncbi:MAG: 50S ribosomal protein L6 [Clostridia bacterium]|jgi:large subunit ribosomal protein L6|nr:50S ribosomal protein L6 [Clostridia bacterium]MBQ6171370.1 50S ribosomal protein L6 [Clostridia bacterium]
MSRIGRKTINIPAGVDVSIADDNTITVKGAKETLTRKLHHDMKVDIDGMQIHVSRPSDDKLHRSLHGLTRTLIANMIEGVTNGYSKSLEIQGIGYKVVKEGKKIVLTIGYSHPVVFEEIPGITLDVPNANTIVVKGPDKQMVGQFAAEIRDKKPPEPYHGKGIRYVGEYVRHKEGKAGKGSKK